MALNACILILNYNGRALLEKYMPSFIRALEKSRYPCRLAVIDNCSADGSAEFICSSYPSVQVYAARENRVLCSYNDAARETPEEILIFMNNDIEVEPDFIDPLIEPFEKDSSVFLVTPRCLSMKDRTYEGNKTRARIHYGLFWASSIYPGFEKQIDRMGLTFQGGFGAFSRKKFLALGGYDDLYLPGRLEDADLCFRAYKRGWKSFYTPKSVVYHEGCVSFHKEFGVRRTSLINWRNTFLFMWKNLSDKSYFLSL